MAKPRIPDPLARRHLVERELSADQAMRHAGAYLAAGRDIDAIDFLAKAEAREELAKLRGRAVEAGDFFRLRAVANAMAEPPDREEWRALEEAARRAGKERYAAEALRQVERGED